jgi:hypothetical protein
MDEAYEFQKAVYRGEIELPLADYKGKGKGNWGHAGRQGRRFIQCNFSCS